MNWRHGHISTACQVMFEALHGVDHKENSNKPTMYKTLSGEVVALRDHIGSTYRAKTSPERAMVVLQAGKLLLLRVRTPRY